jgi:hypothetical protein
VILCGPQAVPKKKSQKLYQDIERMKNTPMRVLHLPLLADIQLQAGDLLLSITFLSCNHYFRKYFKLARRNNLVVAI